MRPAEAMPPRAPEMPGRIVDEPPSAASSERISALHHGSGYRSGRSDAHGREWLPGPITGRSDLKSPRGSAVGRPRPRRTLGTRAPEEVLENLLVRRVDRRERDSGHPAVSLLLD